MNYFFRATVTATRNIVNNADLVFHWKIGWRYFSDETRDHVKPNSVMEMQQVDQSVVYETGYYKNRPVPVHVPVPIRAGDTFPVEIGQNLPEGLDEVLKCVLIMSNGFTATPVRISRT